MKMIETGLPFYDDINKQIVNQPYYNSFIKPWICSNVALPAFQFSISPEETPTMATFQIVNYDTGKTVNFLAYFNTYVNVIDMGVLGYYFTHLGNIASSLDVGNWYFRAINVDGVERWSEVFCVRDLNITANTNTEFKTVEIGLPFFDNINKQIRYSPYYNSNIKEWLSSDNRLPPFQFSMNTEATPTITTFELVDANTGIGVDYQTYFDDNVLITDRDIYGYYFTHLGLTDVVVSGGRYYFYAENADGIKWWSEVFTMCGEITTPTDYLLIGASDYLLIGGTDKLIIG